MFPKQLSPEQGSWQEDAARQSTLRHEPAWHSMTQAPEPQVMAQSAAAEQSTSIRVPPLYGTVT